MPIGAQEDCFTCAAGQTVLRLKVAATSSCGLALGK